MFKFFAELYKQCAVKVDIKPNSMVSATHTQADRELGRVAFKQRCMEASIHNDARCEGGWYPAYLMYRQRYDANEFELEKAISYLTSVEEREYWINITDANFRKVNQFLDEERDRLIKKEMVKQIIKDSTRKGDE